MTGKQPKTPFVAIGVPEVATAAMQGQKHDVMLSAEEIELADNKQLTSGYADVWADTRSSECG